MTEYNITDIMERQPDPFAAARKRVRDGGGVKTETKENSDGKEDGKSTGLEGGSQGS